MPQTILVLQPRVEERPGAIAVAEKVVPRDRTIEVGPVILVIDHERANAAWSEKATAFRDNGWQVLGGDVLEDRGRHDEVEGCCGQPGGARVARRQVLDGHLIEGASAERMQRRAD